MNKIKTILAAVLVTVGQAWGAGPYHVRVTTSGTQTYYKYDVAFAGNSIVGDSGGSCLAQGDTYSFDATGTWGANASLRNPSGCAFQNWMTLQGSLPSDPGGEVYVDVEVHRDTDGTQWYAVSIGSAPTYQVTFTVVNPSATTPARWRAVTSEDFELSAGTLQPGEVQEITLTYGSPMDFDVLYEYWVDQGELGGDWVEDSVLTVGSEDWSTEENPASTGTGVTRPTLGADVDVGPSAVTSTNWGTGGGVTEGTARALGEASLRQDREASDKLLQKVGGLGTTLAGLSNSVAVVDTNMVVTNAYGHAGAAWSTGTNAVGSALSGASGIGTVGTWSTNASLWIIPLPDGTQWNVNPRQNDWFNELAGICRAAVTWLLLAGLAVVMWHRIMEGARMVTATSSQGGGGSIPFVNSGVSIALAVLAVAALTALVIGAVTVFLNLAGVNMWASLGQPLLTQGSHSSWWGEALGLADAFVPLGLLVSLPVAAFVVWIGYSGAALGTAAMWRTLTACGVGLLACQAVEGAPVVVGLANATTNVVAASDGESSYRLPAGFAGNVILDGGRTSVIAGVEFSAGQWESGSCVVSVGEVGVSVYDGGSWVASWWYIVGGVSGGLGVWVGWRVARRTFGVVSEVS